MTSHKTAIFDRHLGLFVGNLQWWRTSSSMWGWVNYRPFSPHPCFLSPPPLPSHDATICPSSLTPPTCSTSEPNAFPSPLIGLLPNTTSSSLPSLYCLCPLPYSSSIPALKFRSTPLCITARRGQCVCVWRMKIQSGRCRSCRPWGASEARAIVSVSGGSGSTPLLPLLVSSLSWDEPNWHPPQKICEELGGPPDCFSVCQHAEEAGMPKDLLL